MKNKSLVILKPDTIKEGNTNAIIEKIIYTGLLIEKSKSKILSDYEVEYLYEEHKHKPFFNDVIKFMTSSQVKILLVSGENAICKIREIAGNATPLKAKTGTIRRLFGKSYIVNSIHSSDSVISAEREILFFFNS